MLTNLDKRVSVSALLVEAVIISFIFFFIYLIVVYTSLLFTHHHPNNVIIINNRFTVFLLFILTDSLRTQYHTIYSFHSIIHVKMVCHSYTCTHCTSLHFYNSFTWCTICFYLFVSIYIYIFIYIYTYIVYIVYYITQ